MERNELKIKLSDCHDYIEYLTKVDGVRCNSALYAFLLSASTNLSMAISHLYEYDEERV